MFLDSNVFRGVRSFKCLCSGFLCCVCGLYTPSSYLFFCYVNLWSVQALFLLGLVVVFYFPVAVLLLQPGWISSVLRHLS